MYRFDRIVRVDVPDAAGREAILKVHTRKMKVDDPDVLRAVAELTPGELLLEPYWFCDNTHHRNSSLAPLYTVRDYCDCCGGSFSLTSKQAG